MLGVELERDGASDDDTVTPDLVAPPVEELALVVVVVVVVVVLNDGSWNIVSLTPPFKPADTKLSVSNRNHFYFVFIIIGHTY